MTNFVECIGDSTVKLTNKVLFRVDLVIRILLGVRSILFWIFPFCAIGVFLHMQKVLVFNYGYIYLTGTIILLFLVEFEYRKYCKLFHIEKRFPFKTILSLKPLSTSSGKWHVPGYLGNTKLVGKDIQNDIKLISSTYPVINNFIKFNEDQINEKQAMSIMLMALAIQCKESM